MNFSPRSHTDATFTQKFAMPVQKFAPQTHEGVAFQARRKSDLETQIWQGPSNASPVLELATPRQTAVPTERPFHNGYGWAQSATPRKEPASPRDRQLETHLVTPPSIETEDTRVRERGLAAHYSSLPERQTPPVAIHGPGAALLDSMLLAHSPRPEARPVDVVARFPIMLNDVSSPWLQNPLGVAGTPGRHDPGADFFDSLLVDYGNVRVGAGPFPYQHSDITQPWRQNEARGGRGGETGLLEAVYRREKPAGPFGNRSTDVTAGSEHRVERFFDPHARGGLAPPEYSAEQSDIHATALNRDYNALQRKFSGFGPQDNHGRRTHKALSAHVNSTMHP